MTSSFELRLHGFDLVVCRLPVDAPVPEWAAGPFVAVVRTPDELSVVASASTVPDVVAREGPWRAFEVVGPLDFALVGVLAELASALADAEVSMFAVSTFDTDWLLVRVADVGRAQWALESHGHAVVIAD